jgi:hypothetical protein
VDYEVGLDPPNRPTEARYVIKVCRDEPVLGTIRWSVTA